LVAKWRKFATTKKTLRQTLKDAGRMEPRRTPGVGLSQKCVGKKGGKNKRKKRKKKKKKEKKDSKEKGDV
jgi:hypothetical protein